MRIMSLPSTSSLVSLSALVLMASPPASAQSTCRIISKQGPGDELGYSLASIGDINGDSTPDFLVGAPRPIMSKAGYVEAISGADGHALYHIDGKAPCDAFGISICAVGDVDHDSRNDFAVGAFNWREAIRDRGEGYVRVYSGATGALLRELHGDASTEQFGLKIVGAPDLDGDQTPDLLVACPSIDVDLDSAVGRVRAISGQSGQMLFEIKGKYRRDGFGESVAVIDDANGDGKPDIIVGAPWGTKLDVLTGYVGFYSGANGSPFAELAGSTRDGGFGRVVASGADLDHDGVRDILIGAGGWSATSDNRMLCYCGRDRSVLFAIQPDGGNFFPGVIGSFAGDWNGDNTADIGIADSTSGRVRIYSGANPTVILSEYSDPTPLSQFGEGLCFPGDLDGDTHPDVVIGSYCWSVREGEPADSFTVGRFTAYSGSSGTELFTRTGGH